MADPIIPGPDLVGMRAGLAEPHDSAAAPLADVQGALGHDRATTTDRYITAHGAAVLGVGPAVSGAYGRKA